MAAPVFASVIFPEKVLVCRDVFLMGSLVLSCASEPVQQLKRETIVNIIVILMTYGLINVLNCRNAASFYRNECSFCRRKY